ncbi:MAG TPA: hypothetical protein VK179_20035 [Bacteroidales bacterium]|nr:hypothetical protein [Bacteroidales bacterium]
MKTTGIILTTLLMMLSFYGISQEFKPNYDEAKMPPYKLPDPLVFEDGTPVKDKESWQKRRAELLRIFEKEEYGVSPAWKGKITATELASNPDAFSGMGVMKQVKLTLINGSKHHSMNLLMYLPKKTGKIPVFLGYNFNGNYTVTDDPKIIAENIWDIEGEKVQQVKAADSDRGSSYNNWQVKEILSRGYGLVTLYYCDADPDFNDGFKNGVHSLYDWKRDSSSWGSIAAWAWGLSRVLDYLETVPQIDSKKVIVMGHSRLGKAALWAGATDQRFAMVISNNSGCGGAALSKRIYGETVGRINTVFPHWFCDNYNKYNEKEDKLPVDQHELLALIAPRPLYVASAEDDQWADPKGEFLSCVAASPVYQLLGKEGLPVTEMPAVNSPVSGTIGYHIRSGGHDVKLYDWQRYLDFADKLR